MGAIGEEELKKSEKMQGAAIRSEEKILVLVRLRPLSEKEIRNNEVSDWECINETTILFRNSLQERSMFPTAHTFGYLVVTALRGRFMRTEQRESLFQCIFAYGQTSSGKTYTMTGITEYAVADIYDYIHKHEERAFVMKFSAMEIYNEAVRDLLSSQSTPLRVRDDPEKGAFVENLTEEILRDWSHLRELRSVCEAQRRIGETSLNETSSRSHQIIRLTVESSAREFLGKENSTTLAASVNFVDLAGSERASQALSVGDRLKEGCHINRSLFTLGIVVRKLSIGRHGHVNYRDSKLTRILQPCLGGNARTAIICTLSPARSHVEQSRNTLFFANCAKEVTIKAKVNVVMSDKALVKHLQSEVARLESELRTPATSSNCNCAALLRKKDLQIEQLEKEVRELSKQREHAESQVKDFLRMVVNDEASSKPGGRDDSPRWQEQCVEVQCIDTDESSKDEISESIALSTGENEGISASMVHRYDNLAYQGIESSPWEEESSLSSFRNQNFMRTRSFRPNLMGNSSSSFEMSGHSQNTPPNGLERCFPRMPSLLDYDAEIARLSRNDSQFSLGSAFVDELTSQNSQTAKDEDIPSILNFVAELKKMAKLEFEKQSANSQSTEPDTVTSGNNSKHAGLDPINDMPETPENWRVVFQRQQKAIVELWQICNISLVHRAYFFLLFKGDPLDSIYIEVELRRLAFLKEAFSQSNHAVEGGRNLTLASSLKALRRERYMLCRLMHKRFSNSERNRLYEKWGINLESKRRKLQFVNRLWSDINDLSHIAESAVVVGKLIRFSEQGAAMKEMFGLTFTPPSANRTRRSLGWKQSMSSVL